MEYLIDDRIIFRVEDNTLINKKNSEQKIDITLTASRLLLLLIRHQGEVLPRETIFKHIWEDYGLNASNSSLNQYISVLRGVFRSLELNGKFIHTVPRTGFMIISDLRIVSLCNTQKPITAKGKGSQRRGVLVVSLLLALGVVQISLLKWSPYVLTITALDPTNECSGLALSIAHNKSLQSLTNPAVHVSKVFSILDCERSVSIDENMDNSNEGKVWISSC